MKELNKEIFEEKNDYVVNGTSAMKLNTAPKRAPEPQRQPQKQPQKAPQPQKQPARLPDIPTNIKIQVMSTILVVTVVLLALVAYHAKVVDITVENNRIQNSIDTLNGDIKKLENEADSKVVLDDVMSLIEEKGLIKPSESNIIKVNP